MRERTKEQVWSLRYIVVSNFLHVSRFADLFYAAVMDFHLLRLAINKQTNIAIAT